MPRPAVKLLRCFRYPTISFNGTFAAIVRGRFADPDTGSVFPIEPPPIEVVSKGLRGAYTLLVSMGGRSSGGCWGGEYEDVGEEAMSVVGRVRSSSREMMWPPREEEMSWTTEPREDSSTEMITFMRGSMREVPGVEDVPGAD